MLASMENFSDHALKADFQYTHSNPYHDKLSLFQEFVLRDAECEQFGGRWNLDVFQREAPLHLEVGSGFGKYMAEYCAANPQVNFIGMDYRFKRSFQVAKKLHKVGHRHFRYLRAKGERIGFMFAPGEVDTIHYLFPDPWPKARHHKKRLFQSPFILAMHKILAPQGTVLIKTDDPGLYEWMQEFLQLPEISPLFTIEMQTQDLWCEYPQHALCQFKTHFEEIFLQQGKKINAMVLRKN